MEVGLYLDIIIYFGILSQTTWAGGGNINLTCNETKKLQSPNYPDDYDDNLNITWNIIAPIYKGIAVIFKDFSTGEGYDILKIQDPERSFSTRNYSGSLENIPPFLSTRSSLLITFQSNSEFSDKGFRLELHCYESSDRTSNIRFKNSTRGNEGIFEVFTLNSPNEWLPVCDESWNSTLAEISCMQLGFPGAYHFASAVDEQYNKSTCAKIDCDKSDFLLQQCTLELKTKNSVNASRLNCFSLAYRGCFPLSTEGDISSISNTTEVGDCLDMCSAMSYQLAAIRWDGCYCLNESQSEIYRRIPNNERCILECDSSHGTQCPPNRKYWAFHYNVTIGFCEHPGDVAHGWWSSNHTYLGSRLTLTCEAGYVINGNKTIDCKPHDVGQKIDWDSEIPHCQSLASTLLPTTAEPPTTSKAPAECRFVCHALISVCLLLVCLGPIIIVLLLYYRKRHVCGTFTNKQLTMRNSPTTSFNDLSPSTVTPIKSIGQGTELEIPTAAPSTQNGCESSIRNGPKEETIKGNPQQGERSTSVLSAEISLAVEYATVNKLRQDDKCSIAATTKADKGKTRADALLEGFDGRAEMPVKYPHQTSFSKSHTMKNRPLPQCPKDRAIKPPIAPRNAQTLTRKDQAGASDFSMNTSKENLLPSTAPRDKGHVNKKAPAGSTPYVKARGKRNNNTKKKGDQVEDVSCDDSSVSSPQRLSDVSSSAYSTIDHPPGKRNMSSEKSVSCNNNSNSVLEVINAVPPEQVYFDIDDTNGNEVSTEMTGGLDGNERFSDDLKPPSPACPAVQHANNLYHTLEPTNAEYEDIRNTEAKFDGNGAYDLLNFE